MSRNSASGGSARGSFGRPWRSSRLWIAASYVMAFLAVGIGILGGTGLVIAIWIANACLLLTFVGCVVGLVHLWWKPRHRVSLPMKAFGTVVGLVPVSLLLGILIAIALRQ